MQLTLSKPKSFWNLAVILGLPGILLLCYLQPVASGIDLSNRLASPDWQHLLGTDAMGRDLLTRLSLSFLTAVFPLWAAVLVASFCGVVLAIVFLALSERFPSYAMKIAVTSGEILAFCGTAIPVCLVVFIWSTLHYQAGIGSVLEALFLVIMLRTFLTVRTLYLTDGQKEYWQAHKAMGGDLAKRLYLYGVMGFWRRRLLELCIFHMQMAVVIEAAMSYLGFGVQEPSPSFGNILTSHFSTYLHGSWGILIYSSAFMIYAIIWPRFFLKRVHP